MLLINFLGIPRDCLCTDREICFSMCLGVLNYNLFLNYLALLESDEIDLELFLASFGVLYTCASV